jgi:hypothetical protein
MFWQYNITPCNVPGEPALPDIMDKGETIQWHIRGVWGGRFNNLERKIMFDTRDELPYLLLIIGTSLT